MQTAAESSAGQLHMNSIAKRAKKKGIFARHLTTIILLVIFIVGIGLIAYPSFSDYWNSFHQTRAIMNYSEAVANMDQKKYDTLIQAAEDYNTELAKTGINWTMSDEQKEKYDSLLNFDGTGNMGYINIPKINVELPIYHGTSDSVLQTSIGHLEETSLPVGGESTHTVLSGHRGLPSAKLFTDLDQLSEGDTFTLNILNQTLTYEVDQIRIVEPTDLSDLQIVDGQDLCTLVTCTPYGINTHRLLVRGHRIANQNGEAQVIADALQIRPIYIMPFVAVPILLILIIAVLVFPKRRR
jgi:sortase A